MRLCVMESKPVERCTLVRKLAGEFAQECVVGNDEALLCVEDEAPDPRVAVRDWQRVALQQLRLASRLWKQMPVDASGLRPLAPEVVTYALTDNFLQLAEVQSSDPGAQKLLARGSDFFHAVRQWQTLFRRETNPPQPALASAGPPM